MNNVECNEDDVRLSDGATRLEGRVEICRNGAWGTLCHSYFDHSEEARVVCRLLGLSVVGEHRLLTFQVAVLENSFGYR